MYSVCVFCGSRVGEREDYLAATEAFGHALGLRGWALVYGGGRVGLMGALADAVLGAGGHAIGVIPGFLDEREVTHAGIQECVTVDDLFERKAVMIERSDAFVALPGGIGTLDEIVEVIAWRQLRQLRQPIGLLNVERFFDPWLDALRHMVREGFLAASEVERLIVREDPEELLDALRDDELA